MQLLFAPLRGVTDAAFRTAHARHFGGFDAALAPFLDAHHGPNLRERDLEDVSPNANPLLKTVPQILSADPHQFVAWSRLLADRGATDVNWNLACPYPMVVKRGRGAGLLPYPARIAAFLEVVCAQVTLSLSVKTRLGLLHSDELPLVLEVLGQYPVVSVAVHARTAKQMYSGKADVGAFVTATANAKMPVIYNGDITSAARLASLRARLPTIDRWMVGRGAVADPLLPLRLRDPTALRGQEISRLRAFLADLLEHYQRTQQGPGHVLSKLHALWTWLGPSFAPAHRRTVRAIAKVDDLRRYRSLVDELLECPGSWAPPNDSASSAR